MVSEAILERRLGHDPTLAPNFSVNRLQCTDEEIAAFFGVSTKTIERRRKVPRFSDVMEHARAKGRVSVRRNLFRLASTGNVAVSIFLAKNLLG